MSMKVSTPNMILTRVLLCTRQVDKLNWFYAATQSIFSFFGWTKTQNVAREIATWTIYLRERLEDLRRCSMLFSDGYSY